MLTLLNNTGRQARVGLTVKVDLSLPPHETFDGFAFTNNFRPGWLVDDLFVGKMLDVFGPLVDLREYIGMNVPRDDTDMPTSIVGLPINNYRYHAGEDWDTYGSLTGGLLNLRYKRHSSALTTRKESNCDHVGYDGSLSLGGKPKSIYTNLLSYSWHGHSLKRYGNADFAARRLYPKVAWDSATQTASVSTAGAIEALSPNPSVINRFEIVDLIKQLILLSETEQQGYVDTGGISTGVGYASNLVSYRDFNVSDIYAIKPVINRTRNYSSMIEVSYTMINDARNNLQNDDAPGGHLHGVYTYDVTHRFRVFCSLAPTHGQLASGIYDPKNVKPTLEWKATYRLQKAWTNMTVPLGYEYHWPIGSTVIEPLLSDEYTGKISLLAGVTTRQYVENREASSFLAYLNQPERTPDEAYRNRLYPFKNWVNRNIEDFIPCAAFSVADAITSDTSNLIENLPQLPGIIGAVPDVLGLASDLYKIIRGDYSAIKSLIRHLGEGWLGYNYALRSSPTDIKDVNAAGREVYRSIKDGIDALPDQLYGSYHYVVPEGFDGGQVTVTVKSKIRLRNSPASAVMFMLMLNQNGLMPTLGRLWDLVPFSFVVDWFAGISQNLEDIDNWVVGSFLDVDYYCHTYEFRHFPDLHSLIRHGISPSDDFCLRAYHRRISRYHPLPPAMVSKRDFHPPAGLNKNLLSAGSLLVVRT